jgi:hypothetical protein
LQKLARIDILRNRRLGAYPLMRPVLLPERGLKVRIATKSQAPFVVLSQEINGTLLNCLKVCPQAGPALTDDEAAMGRLLSPSSLRQEWLSADLSAASDYIPHSVAQAWWRGVYGFLHSIGHEATTFLPGFRGMDTDPHYQGRPQAGWQGLLGSILGPQLWDEHPEYGPTTRGTLMGTALTWPLLSTLNVYAAAKAYSSSYRGDVLAWLITNSDNGMPFVTCGDDMAAVWMPNQSEAYFANLESIGLVVNRKKSFRSRDALVFVEKQFVFDGLYRPALPAGRMVFSALTRAKATRDNAPAWVTLPSVINTTMEGQPRWRRRAIMKIAELLHPDAFHVWKRSGRPIHWPVALGGWGINHPDDPRKLTAPLKLRKAAAVAITSGDVHGGPRRLQFREFQPLPKVLRDLSQDVRSRASPQNDAADSIPLDEAMEVIHQKMGALLRGDPFTPYQDRKYIAPRAKEFRKAVNDLASQWGGVHPLSDKAALSYEDSNRISLSTLAIALSERTGILPALPGNRSRPHDALVPHEWVRRRQDLLQELTSDVTGRRLRTGRTGTMPTPVVWDSWY